MGADEAKTELESRITSPKKMVSDEGSVEERPLDEMIQAHKHLASTEAANNGPGWGIRVARAVKGGTILG